MQSVNKIKGILNGMHVKKLELKKIKEKLKRWKTRKK
jgi:hypothetical protein